MTKKHFIALADAIRETKPTADADATNGRYVITTSEPLQQWEADRDMLADFCQSQNPRFNRQRWLAYVAGECGPNGGSKKQ